MSGDAAHFHHEALFYADEQEFLAEALRFIQEGLAAGEPVLVAVSRAKIRLLESRLNGPRGPVRFADIAEIGRNPARILPVWREFVDNQAVAGRPVRGIGEPVWAERSAAELVECEHADSVLNIAFADAPAWRLLCSYDTESLTHDAIGAAERSHPFVLDHGVVHTNDAYLEPEKAPDPLQGALPDPSGDPEEVEFGRDDLSELRSLAYRHAKDAGLDPERTANLVLAVSEVATNSVRHADGRGALRLWREPDAVLCEVHDRGHIDSPLVGRESPAISALDGRGLWVVNQLCDLMQIRSSGKGSVVRIHVRLD